MTVNELIAILSTFSKEEKEYEVKFNVITHCFPDDYYQGPIPILWVSTPFSEEKEIFFLGKKWNIKKELPLSQEEVEKKENT